MAENQTKKARRKSVNTLTLSLNARKMASAYGIAGHGANGLDGKKFFSDFAKGLDDPRSYRKKGTLTFK